MYVCLDVRMYVCMSWMNEWLDELILMAEWMNGWMYRGIYGWTNGWIVVRMNDWMNKWTNMDEWKVDLERINNSMNEWLNEWMNNWMDWWVDGLTERVNKVNERLTKWMHDWMNSWVAVNAYHIVRSHLSQKPSLWPKRWTTQSIHQAAHQSTKWPAFHQHGE